RQSLVEAHTRSSRRTRRNARIRDEGFATVGSLRLGGVALAAARHLVSVLEAERPRRVLDEGIAIALAVRGPHERRDDLETPFGDVRRLAPEVGEAKVDVELEEVDSCGLAHTARVRATSDEIIGLQGKAWRPLESRDGQDPGRAGAHPRSREPGARGRAARRARIRRL